ncbi:Amino acid transporter, transmembrane domain containing protein [Parasponia andersonii]|uniref:Amino acid transporter, transmembrane domain containing protein n=1 Tax=Parasponia andersonii TaxID=3476 RepID=A0A2P5DV45_PARAD|nr:Amino acid transporter, transmembrane domain containing protein [Parasponia andersonii]
MASDLRTPLTQGQRAGSSFLKACFNGTNAFLGIGLLTVPYAVSSGGWLSLVFFFMVAIMTFYTGILLKTCMDADPSVKSYLDIAERAFGKRGRVIVMIIMNSELYLVAIGLLILESENLQKLFPNFMVKIGALIIEARQSFVLITALVILPSMLLTDLSILSYVSATGVFSCLIILGSIFCVGAFGGVGFHEKGTLLNVSGLPTAVSLYIVCFAGHPVIPSIYTSMRKRQQFSQVLLFSFVLTTFTYLLTASESYLMYGESVESQITLNLPTKLISSKVAIYTTLLIPVTRYALMLTPVANAIEGGLSEDYKNLRTIKILVRMVLLVSSTIVAYVFPYFENLMAIVGSIFVVLASFVLPCLCYLKISSSHGSWNFKLVGNVTIIVFATLAGVLGTYSSIAELVQNY